MAALVEAFVRQELQLGGVFHLHAGGDLALQIGGVGAQRLQHGLLVLAEQGFHEDGGVAQVGGHADLGHADHVLGERVVMHVAALEHFRQHMAHLFADAQGADRFFLGIFVHGFCPLPAPPRAEGQASGCYSVRSRSSTSKVSR